MMAVLTELQSSVGREYDELRAYMATLAGVPPSPAPVGAPAATRFSLDVRVEASINLVDHILQIAREGLSDVRRHASADAASGSASRTPRYALPSRTTAWA